MPLNLYNIGFHSLIQMVTANITFFRESTVKTTIPVVKSSIRKIIPDYCVFIQ